MTTLHLGKSNGRSPFRLVFILIPVLLASFGFSPAAFAVSPAPDGGYANQNTAEGDNALFSLTAGWDNTANGYQALFSNTTGGGNTANGAFALFSNTTGSTNTANGFEALFKNTGNQNTANGAQALSSNNNGCRNTASGDLALELNTTGSSNTAMGFGALASNTTGVNNTATGDGALQQNTGDNNTAAGASALQDNGSGVNNTANGFNALFSNTTGSTNTAEGFKALYSNTGSNNIALGSNAGGNLTTGSNNIDIGTPGVAAESNTIRIGSKSQTKTFIAGIRKITTTNADAVPVVIDSAGQLGTTSSSRRFKKEIKAMDKTSEAILGLKPVTFHYKSDSTGTPQFGLIAEEVAKVNPDLVVHNADGEIYTVRYEAVNAMLLNEFLKEHHQVQDLKGIVAEQQKQIKALTADLQRVSDQLAAVSPSRGGLEASKFAVGRIRGGGPAPQIVDNDK